MNAFLHVVFSNPRPSSKVTDASFSILSFYNLYIFLKKKLDDCHFRMQWISSVAAILLTEISLLPSNLTALKLFQ